MSNSTRKWYIGSLVFSAAVAPVMAQSTEAASAPPTRASEPVPDATPGTDPTWMVVDVGIALLIGAVVGYLVGVRQARARASHA
jgi:hypothetical protein